MLWRTHIAIGICALLVMRQYIEVSLLFAGIFLIAVLVPDIDSAESVIGKRTRPVSTILSWLIKHRGMIHSLSFCAVVSLPLIVFFPVTIIPFFTGYSLHLLSDGFTKQGVRLFYPFKFQIKGWMRVGGLAENLILLLFLTIDVLLFMPAK